MQVTYEAYGAGGTGFILECLTDNLNRSASEVRAAVMKAGGKMADPGSVCSTSNGKGKFLSALKRQRTRYTSADPMTVPKLLSWCHS